MGRADGPAHAYLWSNETGIQDLGTLAGDFTSVALSINDNGDVPPRWKIVNRLKKPRGVVIDPKHKELIVADMTLNSVLTYSLPEMFEVPKKQQTKESN